MRLSMNMIFEFQISDFPEPLLFMLVLGREGRVSWDEMGM